MSDAAFKALAQAQREEDRERKAAARRADKVLESLHPAQRTMAQDPSKYKAARCPRRAGKSRGAAGYAAWVGEANPGFRILIIGLTLKSARDNFWKAAPGGIHTINSELKLGFSYHDTDSRWMHTNGSIGHLAGAETVNDLERLRGSKVEADLIIIDECKSFAPDVLHMLINDIVLPGLMTRDGTLLLIGTPGSVPVGPFYEATCERSRSIDGLPTCVNIKEREEWAGRVDLNAVWSLHTWSLRENTARPHQWRRALETKARNAWDDSHPTWRREYLGEWTTDSLDLVYAYGQYLTSGRVSWAPNAYSPTELPKDGGPWHFVGGLDFGFEEPNAIVVWAYGETCNALYQVYEWKESHLSFDDIASQVEHVAAMFPMETFVYDYGGSGAKSMGESLATRGFSMTPADKFEKMAFIELFNSDIASGRIKVISGGKYHTELCSVQFDLKNGTKADLARRFRLREDPACPNHLCDAGLYAWRYCYHQFSRGAPKELEPYTEEWWKAREKSEMARMSKRRGVDKIRSHGRVDHMVSGEMTDRLEWRKPWN